MQILVEVAITFLRIESPVEAKGFKGSVFRLELHGPKTSSSECWNGFLPLVKREIG